MFSREKLLAQARRRYPDFLRAIVEEAEFFPLEIQTGKTNRARDYAALAAELAIFREDAAALGLTVEWRTVSDPRFGPHERPECAFFADETAFLSALGKSSEARHFREDMVLIRTECPILDRWLHTNVLAVVEQHGVWPKLLRCVHWFSAHPRSGMYLRQIPVEGVDTKFFERHASILDELLLQIDPGNITAAEARFEARHGLRWEEPLVRVRFLDSELQASHGFPVADLAVPAPVFRSLPFGSVTAIITENLRNFLALPPLFQSIAVLGSGDAASLLVGTPWLAQSRILYWGDMDARGFSILARMRVAFPHTESVMMDVPTLETHLLFATEVTSYHPQIAGLTIEESGALQKLGSAGLWLEQERIPFHAVMEMLELKIRRNH